MTLKNLIEEVNLLLMEAFPAAQAHVNDCPEGFVRPAFLIRCSRLTRADVNCSTVAISAVITVAYIPEVDDRGVADGDALSEALETMLDLFRAGYIRVADRAPKVKAVGRIENAIAYVDLTIDYYEDRAAAAADAPKMGAVETSIKINQEG